MRFFVTGVSGILGSDVKAQLESLNHDIIGFDSKQIDITSLGDVMSKVSDFKPDVIIHCAAMTNVDLCEVDKTEAFKVNVLGPQNLAISANKINSKIVYVSSCGVYGDSKSTPYNEQDSTVPLNYHHYTKIEGERRVIQHNSQFLIIRPGWLFGGELAKKKNFVEARRKEATLNAVIKSAIDKVGSPTYTVDVAKQMIHLISGDFLGVFNVVNEGVASRFDYVSEIIAQLNLPTVVEGVNSDSFPRNALMPNNESLENLALNLNNVNKMRNWKIALKEYITNNY